VGKMSASSLQSKRRKVTPQEQQALQRVVPLDDWIQLDPDAVGLGSRRQPRNTLPIRSYGLVFLASLEVAVELGRLALVSIPHNQILYFNHWWVEESAGPNLANITGMINAETFRFPYELRDHDTICNLAMLIQVILESNKKRFVLDEDGRGGSMVPLTLKDIRDLIVQTFARSTEFMQQMTIASQQEESSLYKDEIRRGNKAEVKRLMRIIGQLQPQFNLQRDTIILDPRPLGRNRRAYDTVMPAPMFETLSRNLKATLWWKLPKDILYNHIAKHLSTSQRKNLRLMSVDAATHIRHFSRSMYFEVFTAQNHERMVKTVLNSDVIKLNITDFDGLEDWDAQQAAMPELLSPDMTEAFAKLHTLELSGEICADPEFYKFLSGVLLEKNCRLQCIRFKRCGWQGMYHIDTAECIRINQVLCDAIAGNTTVKEFDLTGPYLHSFDDHTKNIPLLKTWLEGIARRKDIEVFRYDSEFDNWRDAAADMRTPTEMVLPVLINNAESLREIRLTVRRNPKMDRFYEIFTDTPKNKSKTFSLIDATDD
jgi:hypothetical protein